MKQAITRLSPKRKVITNKHTITPRATTDLKHTADTLADLQKRSRDF